jgi:hypothetical protein
MTPRLRRIEAAIQSCNDKKLLRVLYRASWAEILCVQHQVATKKGSAERLRSEAPVVLLQSRGLLNPERGNSGREQSEGQVEYRTETSSTALPAASEVA